MTTINPTPQHDKPRKLSQLEYARMIAQAQGPETPVTWLTVAELIDLLEQTGQAQALPVSLPIFAEVAQ